MAPIRCPTCKGPSTLASTNGFRPFCSERCQLIDLGAWLDESYTVPGTAQDDAAPPRQVDERLD